MAGDSGAGLHGGRQSSQCWRAAAAQRAGGRHEPQPDTTQALLVVPAALLLGYGLLRLSTSLFTELRELVFSKATEGAARSISLEVFRHLHALSLRFHLERQTGGMTRDIERGTRAVRTLIVLPSSTSPPR